MTKIHIPSFPLGFSQSFEVAYENRKSGMDTSFLNVLAQKSETSVNVTYTKREQVLDVCFSYGRLWSRVESYKRELQRERGINMNYSSRNAWSWGIVDAWLQKCK